MVIAPVRTEIVVIVAIPAPVIPRRSATVIVVACVRLVAQIVALNRFVSALADASVCAFTVAALLDTVGFVTAKTGVSTRSVTAVLCYSRGDCEEKCCKQHPKRFHT